MYFGSLILSLLGFLFFIVTPALALLGWLRVRRLEQDRDGRRMAGTDAQALNDRLAAIEQRLAAIERGFAEPPFPEDSKPAVAPPRARPEVAQPPPSPQPPPSTSIPPPRPVTPARSILDLETLIAGQWLHGVGIAAVLVGAAFFLKYAFDNDWIGERGRIAIGLLTGIGLLLYSQALLRRAFVYFSEGMAGLGAGIVYLSLYAGWSNYALFPAGTAFASMVIMTAALMGLAVGRDSPRIAALALIGGFVTPWLTSTGKDAQVVLFSYLAVLDAGVLGVARRKKWRYLEVPAFVFTQLYFWGWMSVFYAASKPVVRTLGFAFLFFLEFLALPVVRVRRFGSLSDVQAALVLANGALFTAALHARLWPAHRWLLTLAVLGLAVLHLLVAYLVPATHDERVPAKPLFAGMALTLATIAIPIRLDGDWVTMAFATEAAVLIWSGFRTRRRELRSAGLLLFAGVGLRLLSHLPAADRFVLNARFGLLTVAMGCCAAAAYCARRNVDQLAENERDVYAGLGVAANVLALWALSLEVFTYFRPQGDAGAARDFELRQHLTLTLLWTGYGVGLLWWGMRRHLAGVRWQGLVLLGVTIAKVFFFDLGFLSGFYRIVSSIALGIVLLFVSFLYQERLTAERGVET